MKLANYLKFIVLMIALSLVGCGSSRHVGQPVAVVPPKPVLPPYLLHLPGIGGKRSIDTAMTHGFTEGGYTGEVEIYDWTEQDPGLAALISEQRNRKEAKIIAEKITERFDADPTAPIYITSHSGGGGLAVWALEDLPPRVIINTMLMMSPALSPKYDLSEALRHVSGKVYVFSSLNDVLVLSTGCRLMGTIDGVKTAAAGFCGFVRPDAGDVGQYAKLVDFPYNRLWLQYDNRGNHIGAMSRTFARVVLAPLVLTGKLPPENDAAASSLQAGQAIQ